MNPELIEFAKLNTQSAEIFRVYFPEIVLAVVALFTLVVDVFLPKDNLKIGRTIASCGMLFAALLAFAQMMNWPPMDIGKTLSPLATLNWSPTNSVLNFPPFALFSTILIGCGFLALRLTGIVAKRAEFAGAITNCLIVIATLAASALFKQNDFLGFFVALETLTITLYALVGSYRGNAFSLEAGVKYLIAGAVSGGLLAFGIMLLYGFAAMASFPDPLSYKSIVSAIAHDPANPLAIAGTLMVLGGVMFKLGIFPMNLWIPDTYQGAPLHVTFLLATLSKATGLFAMCFLLCDIFLKEFPAIYPVLLVATIISMIYSNATALGQQNVKRLLGLSGASHASYLMLTLLAIAHCNYQFALTGGTDGRLVLMIFAVVLYMGFYVLASYPIFSAMAHVPANKGCEAELHIDDFGNLVSRSPLLTTALTTGLASLAGIPPTVGFIAKLALLWVIFYAGLYVPAVIMLVCVGASVYYYFAWARKFYEKSDLPEAEIAKPVPVRAFWLAIFSALTVLGCVIYFYCMSIVG